MDVDAVLFPLLKDLEDAPSCLPVCAIGIVALKAIDGDTDALLRLLVAVDLPDVDAVGLAG